MRLLALLASRRSADSSGSWRKRRDPDRLTTSALSEIPDASVVERIRSGDDAEVERVFRSHAAELIRFVSGYVGDLAVAEELVQDVFLWILRNRAQWSVRESVRTYLFGAARNHALNYLKHRAVESRWAVSAPLHSTPTQTASADSQLILEEQITLLRRAIDQLPETRRTVLTLRWMHELSYAEIATIVGSSQKAVENQLNRTLHQLRTLIGDS